MQVLNITAKKALKSAKRDLVKTERLAEQYKELLKRHQEDDESYLRKRHFNSPLVRRIEELENEAEQLHLKIDMLKKNGNFGEISLELIEQVCIKYRLRFLPAGQFSLPVPTQATKAIREFEEKIESENSPYSRIKLKYHLLAPKGCFILRPKEKIIDPLIVAEVANYGDTWESTDPELYRTDSKFYRVYFWGKMFTPWRRFLGLFSEFNRSMKWIVGTSITLIPAIVHLVTDMPLIHGANDPILVTFALMLLAACISIVSAIGINTIDESNNWDSPFKSK